MVDTGRLLLNTVFITAGISHLYKAFAADLVQPLGALVWYGGGNVTHRFKDLHRFNFVLYAANNCLSVYVSVARSVDHSLI